MNSRIVRIVLPAVLTIACEQTLFTDRCFAITYLTIEQAQELLAPHISWKQLSLHLSEEQVDSIEELSEVSVLSPEMKLWNAPNGDFFIVDNVLGKHEFITYAALLSAEGSIKGLEILDYRETYGEQIRRPEWRSQFVGKSQVDQLVFEKDILNISGATISCSQITKGMRRLLATYQIVLKNLKIS